MAQYSRSSYSRQQRQKEKGGRISVSNFLLFYGIPFVIINLIIFFLATSRPSVELEVIDEHNFQNVVLKVKHNKFYPIKKLEVLFDNEPIELNKEETGTSRVYTTTWTKNGGISAVVYGFNGMTDADYENVGSIDEEPPVIQGEVTQVGKNSEVLVSFEDSQSGVDVSSIYATTPNGLRVNPLSVNEAKSEATFNLDSYGSLDVHISDKVGNQSVAHFNQTEDTTRW